jgi:hypothetical protein
VLPSGAAEEAIASAELERLASSPDSSSPDWAVPVPELDPDPEDDEPEEPEELVDEPFEPEPLDELLVPPPWFPFAWPVGSDPLPHPVSAIARPNAAIGA